MNGARQKKTYEIFPKEILRVRYKCLGEMKKV